MTARTLRPYQDERTRAAIQSTMLVRRLQDCALGKTKMTREQIKCAEILLRKTIPDLASLQVGGDASNPLTIVVRKFSGS